MLPRWHIFWGAVFTAILWFFFPETEWYYLALILFSSFLIDFDHYMCAVYETGKIGLFAAFEYNEKLGKKEVAEYKRGKREKGDFHVFHTVEFHLFTLLLGLMFPPFLYVFAGMVFHSILDVIELTYDDRLYRREYFLTRWIGRKLREKKSRGN
jgi:hypothetical protein